MPAIQTDKQEDRHTNGQSDRSKITYKSVLWNKCINRATQNVWLPDKQTDKQTGKREDLWVNQTTQAWQTSVTHTTFENEGGRKTNLIHIAIEYVLYKIYIIYIIMLLQRSIIILSSMMTVSLKRIASYMVMAVCKTTVTTCYKN